MNKFRIVNMLKPNLLNKLTRYRWINEIISGTCFPIIDRVGCHLSELPVSPFR